MKAFFADLPSESSVTCDKSLPAHKECEALEDFKYSQRCLDRFDKHYDRRWIRNPVLREQVIAVKENFGLEVSMILRSYDFQVIVPRNSSVDQEDLDYHQWGIIEGKRTLMR